MGEGAIIAPPKYPANDAVIRLLEQVLFDAKQGGTTSVALVTVNAYGQIQTPCQGGQIREIAQGVERLRHDIQDSYARAVQMVGKYESQRP